MNLNFLYYVAGFFLIVILGGTIYILYNRTRRAVEPENEPIVHNYLLSQCPFREGILKDMKISEERIKIELYPRDINYIKAENDEDYRKLLKKYTLFFDKRQVEIQTGEASPNRTIIKAYPHDIDLIPESLKTTAEGKAIMEKIQTNNQLKDESELMKQRMQNLKKLSFYTVGAEIYTESAEKMRKIMDDMREVMQKEEKKFSDKDKKS